MGGKLCRFKSRVLQCICVCNWEKIKIVVPWIEVEAEKTTTTNDLVFFQTQIFLFSIV
ncbi:Uncharacterised protein [Chlamydia trachomatis]|nr:Uncharacterised protein [Chlamydia trachomatis]